MHLNSVAIVRFQKDKQAIWHWPANDGTLWGDYIRASDCMVISDPPPGITKISSHRVFNGSKSREYRVISYHALNSARSNNTSSNTSEEKVQPRKAQAQQ